MRQREPRVLRKVPRLAVHRNDDLGPHPLVHLDQLGTPGMARNVHVRLAFGNDLHAEIGQLVHDPPDRHLIARNDARREDHGIGLAELQLMRP